ncbi:MAG: hypothetical protein ACO1Q7_18650 [Gemmatimonas sp.]
MLVSRTLGQTPLGQTPLGQTPLGNTRPRLRFSLAVLSLAALASLTAACSDDDSITDPVGDPAECSTSTTVAQEGTWVQLCKISGPVRHVRIENVKAGRTHASAQFVLGTTAAPTVTTGALGLDQFRVVMYGGGTPAPTAQLEATFGVANATINSNASFLNDGATVCFDLHDGTATTGPQFVIWVSGQKGANCLDRATLTLSTASGIRTEWSGSVGALNKTLSGWFRPATGAGTTPKVTVSTTPVLEAATISASTTCSNLPTASADWQSLCTPGSGLVHHVRIESASSTANNSYFYAVFGQDASPTGNPTGAAGKLIITGGRSSSGASWTWFRFGAAGTTTQFNFATDAGAALYVAAPHTVCFDIGTAANGNARLVYWATGAKGADCAVKSTLTLARALYDSSTDTTTGTIFDAPLVAGKLNFVKTNNTSATLGRVTMSSEAAAL